MVGLKSGSAAQKFIRRTRSNGDEIDPLINLIITILIEKKVTNYSNYVSNNVSNNSEIGSNVETIKILKVLNKIPTVFKTADPPR